MKLKVNKVEQGPVLTKGDSGHEYGLLGGRNTLLGGGQYQPVAAGGLLGPSMGRKGAGVAEYLSGRMTRSA